jgi:maltose alpha-D-glucosyltransferase/alpha-amylase
VRDTVPAAAVTVEESWREIFQAPARTRVVRLLADALARRGWFGGKPRAITAADLLDGIEIDERTVIAVMRVEYAEGEEGTYAVPLAFVERPEPRAEPLLEVTVQRRGGVESGVVVDGAQTHETALGLMDAIRRRRRLRGGRLDIVGTAIVDLRRARVHAAGDARPMACTNGAAWRLGDEFVLTLRRRIEPGVSPELEIARHLERVGFEHSVRLKGVLELHAPGAEPATLAVAREFVPGSGDAWSYTVDEIERYFERALAARDAVGSLPEAPGLWVAYDAGHPPEAIGHVIGAFLDTAALLGRRTGELHVALSDGSVDTAFAPEPIAPYVRRSQYQSLRNLLVRTVDALDQSRGALAGADQPLADEVLARRDAMLERFGVLRGSRVAAGTRIRLHGEYRLQRVLHTGKDFVITDFEGDPLRPIGERRLKRSPLVDVACMLRSFETAVESVLGGLTEGSLLRREDPVLLRPWARHWNAWVSASFLRGYLTAVAATDLVPRTQEELTRLLDVYVLESALSDVGYEIEHRPEWAGIALRGVLTALGVSAAEMTSGST